MYYADSVHCAFTLSDKDGLNVGVSWQGFEFPFVPTNTNITAMTAVNVSASSRAAIQWSSYSYDFGDSNTTVDTHQQNQTHVYSRNGTYNFSVAVLAMVNDFHAYEGHYEAQIVAQGLCTHTHVIRGSPHTSQNSHLFTLVTSPWTK